MRNFEVNLSKTYMGSQERTEKKKLLFCIAVIVTLNLVCVDCEQKLVWYMQDKQYQLIHREGAREAYSEYKLLPIFVKDKKTFTPECGMEEFQGTASSETEWSHDVTDPDGVVVTKDNPWIIPEDDYAGWNMTFSVSKTDNGVKTIECEYSQNNYHKIIKLTVLIYSVTKVDASDLECKHGQDCSGKVKLSVSIKHDPELSTNEETDKNIIEQINAAFNTTDTKESQGIFITSVDIAKVLNISKSNTIWIRSGHKINPMDNDLLCGCETGKSSKSDGNINGSEKVVPVILVIVMITALLILLAAVLYKFRGQIQKKLKLNLPLSNM